jgi:hypothetical protein
MMRRQALVTDAGYGAEIYVEWKVQRHVRRAGAELYKACTCEDGRQHCPVGPLFVTRSPAATNLLSARAKRQQQPLMLSRLEIEGCWELGI